MQDDSPESPAVDGEEVLSLDQAMAMVREFIQAKDLRAAIDLLEHILSGVKDNAQVWSYLAVANFHSYGAAKAREILEQAVQALPNDASLRNNLGNACAELGDVQAAIDAYEKSIELDPKLAESFCNLASIMKNGGNPEFAEKLLRTAIHLREDFGLAYQNLASLLLNEGRPREAIEHFWKATVYLPRPSMPIQLMALAYWHAGHREESIDLVRKWAAERPEDPQAQHLLSSFTGENVPDQAPAEYVTKLFDKFANSFDSKLDDLEYRAPELVGGALADAIGTPKGELAILDAGAGTGKCAKYLKPFASRLVGVDLSSGMLERAELLGAYDELIVGDLTAFVQAHPSEYDIIVSADTLCYFGRLEDFGHAAASSLRPGGRLIFTVEAMKDGDTDFRLAVHGRYEHRENYVRRCLMDAGLTLEQVTEVTLRKENALPVTGLLITAVLGSSA